jgi:hypothetical protein
MLQVRGRRGGGGFQCCIEFETEYMEGFCASHAVIRGSGGVSDTAVRGREEFFDAAGSLRLQKDGVEGFFNSKMNKVVLN